MALEASGWKAFPTQAAAEAYAKENPAQRGAGYVTGPDSSALSALGLHLPSLTNLRDLVIRSVKVVIGVALIIIGLVKLSGAPAEVTKLASNIKVVPI